MRRLSICILSLLTPPSLVFAKDPQLPDHRIWGNANGNIVVEEYVDALSPASQKAEQSINKPLMKKFGEKIRFEVRYYPLQISRQSINAAVASDCAGRQGKYNEYIDKLAGMRNATKVPSGISSFQQLAQSLRLDFKKFSSCIRSSGIKKNILSEREYAKKNGIEGVPSYLVNGVMVSATLESLSKRIEGMSSQSTSPTARAVHEFPQKLGGSYVPSQGTGGEIVDITIASVLEDEQAEKFLFSGPAYFDASGKAEMQGMLDLKSDLMSITFSPAKNLPFDTSIPFEGTWNSTLQKITAKQVDASKKIGELRLKVWPY